jgi:hypothetical protein
MFRIVAALAAALSLAACASPYVGNPFDRGAANVHSVGLAGNTLPDKAIVPEAASIGSNFGLIGALVNAGIQSSRENAVNGALTGAGYKAETQLQARIIADLGSQGYTVKPLETPTRAKREFLASYPSAQPVDAYLDVVVVSYGYLSAGAFKPFRPSVLAKVRLVSAKDTSKTLMENMIAYNEIYQVKGVITLTPNPAYAFNNRADLLADPKKLAAGLEDALNQVADTAAQLLR